MARWLPRIDAGAWGGGDIDGQNDCKGLCIVVQWLGIIIEIGIGKVRS